MRRGALRSLLIFGLCWHACSDVQAEAVPSELEEHWRRIAPRCESNYWNFPAKRDGSECDDGDVTLFAGLLCYSGEQAGCEAVSDAQDSNGRWFRSPRRKATNNLNKPNSFSPDMALGAQLYIVATRNIHALQSWLNWMDNARPCWIGTGDNCLRGPFLRFCPDDNEGGCTVRPTDAALMWALSDRFNVWPPETNTQNLFRQAGSNFATMIWLDSQLNKPGYSQHLVAVEILLLRALGYNSNDLLERAAQSLSARQPRNPFFAYLAFGRTAAVRDLVVSQCPGLGETPPVTDEWAWERSDDQEAWKKSMVWDCIFMANLLKR